MAAKNVISQRLQLDGAEEIKKALADIGKTGEKAFAELKNATDGVGSKLKASLQAPLAQLRLAMLALQQTGLTRSFADFTAAAGRFGAAVQTTATRFSILTAAIGVALERAGRFFVNQAAEAA